MKLFLLIPLAVIAFLAAGCGIDTWDNQEYYCKAENQQHQILVYAYRDSSQTSHDTVMPNVEAFCKLLKQNPKWTSYSVNK